MKRRTKIDYSPGFEEFWALYPRRINKQQAFTKYKELTTDCHIPHEDLLTATRNYIKVCKDKGTGVSFIMHPATFLGPRDRWRDYLELDPLYEYKNDMCSKIAEMLNEYWAKPIHEDRVKQALKGLLDNCFDKDEVLALAYEIRDKMNEYNEGVVIKGTEDKYIAEAHNWLKRLR